MLTFNVLILVSLAYVAFLFGVAFLAERRALAGGVAWLRSPLVYTLSLSIYCTAWTFYGAVGYAARSGLEYLTIYLGPSLVMLGWWWLVRKLVRIGKVHRITSIADLISSRFGKSTMIGVIVTVLVVAGVTPYIALQLQSISLSFSVFALGHGDWPDTDLNSVALWSAAGLALFTILFGTRNLDANERHHGVVMAIAVEAVVKLAALLAVGIFVVWGIGGGIAQTLDRIDASQIAQWEQPGGRWIGLTFVSAAAFLCLPRMFQVLVVENANERHLATASWAFPLYVLLMSLFVVPIAVVGLDLMPAGTNPDMFVLTIPLSQDQTWLAMFSFLGGFSSATSMVIVATIALATMVSNHIVVPIWLGFGGQTREGRADVRLLILTARRLSIIGVLGLGYVYYRQSGGGTALSAMGLIAFVGVAQILPAMLGGLFWRGATRLGAAAGLISGFVVWLWTLFLPSFGPDVVMSASLLAQGPAGLGWLAPHALFGITGIDPLMHAILWSMLINCSAFLAVSLVTFPTPLERVQGAGFVDVFDHAGPGATSWRATMAEAEDLLIMAQRILGPPAAQGIFQRAAEGQGKAGFLPDVTPAFLDTLERALAGSVGAATAHAMLRQLSRGASITVEDLMAVADEAAQIMEYSSQLETKSAELERTARALHEANEKLTQLSIQKDTFLGQISHELRTPMTSIRAFSEILKDSDLSAADQQHFAGIIQTEAKRLTRLLDDLLDLSVLENGSMALQRQEGTLRAVIDRAIVAAGVTDKGLRVLRHTVDEQVVVQTDLDRLSQVFINLMTNAQKYSRAARPELRIAVDRAGGQVVIDFVDNGQGIAAEHIDVIFEKFARLSDPGKAGGAGLGLAICREIMLRLGGSIIYLPGQGGGAFRVSLPLAEAQVSA